MRVQLQNIADVIIMKANTTENLGLFNGKMGMAIYLYHYSRLTGINFYEESAGQLIDDIYNKINPSTALNFSDGIIGIFWGIDYLAKNGFIDINMDEAICEIDQIVFQSQLKNIVCIESSNDLFGFGLYYLFRFRGREEENENATILFIKQMTIYMVDECERLLIKKKYLEVNIPRISGGQLNSIIYFLLEVHRAGLFPVKVNKLIFYLPQYMEEVIQSDDCKADLLTMQQLTVKVCEILTDSALLTQFKEILMKLNSLQDLNGEMIIEDFCRLNWHSMVYFPLVNNKGIFSSIDHNMILNFINEAIRSHEVGLDKGLAGLGLILMNDMNDTNNSH